IAKMLSEDHFAASWQGGRGRKAATQATALRRPAGDTTALAVVDAEGNAVSLIPSLFDDFGGGVYVADPRFWPQDRLCGVELQTRRCGFTLQPDHLNALGPSKRPMHTLCTSMVTRDDKLFMSLVTPAGHAQTQTLVQVLNNIVLFGMDPQEAVEAPRWIDE